MTRALVNDTGSPRVRAIVLLGCFVGGSGAGAWLGYALAVVSGLTSADPSRLAGGNLAASALALGALVGLSTFAERTLGRGVEPPARARAEGRGARNSLIYAATFSVFAVVFVSFAFGRVSPLSLLPVVALAVLLAFGAVRRDPLLRLAALCAGAFYVLGTARRRPGAEDRRRRKNEMPLPEKPPGLPAKVRAASPRRRTPLAIIPRLVRPCTLISPSSWRP
jgi:hypothetical protein